MPSTFCSIIVTVVQRRIMARLRSLCKNGTLAKDRAKKRKNYTQKGTALRLVLR